MNKNGPIVIIEDDQDDQDLVKEILKELNYLNECIDCGNGKLALDYLTTSNIRPFLILSDINMPQLNGFQLRDMIQNNDELRIKCIPYLFFTTAANPTMVVQAYTKSAQGLFVKPSEYSEFIRVIRNIVEYWKDCRAPDIN